VNESASTTVLREARDLLLRLSGDHEKAVEQFRWPTFGESFNWATDWFDVIARGNDTVALWIVEEDGRETKVSFDEMARRSDQVAAWLEHAGLGAGDSVVLMLGNQIELWESMLAVMKVGGVIMPTTTAVGAPELADRIARGGARFVIANPADAEKFDDVPGTYTRVLVGAEDRTGWLSYRDAYGMPPRTFQARTAPSDPLLYYFTSGTTSRPKLVVHTQVSYPVGHLSTLFFLGVRPGDVHLNISAPGWAKHAWSCFFGPWNAEATIFIYNYSRFDAAALLAQIRRAEVTTFCAPPTVWRMLIQADLSGGGGHLREAIGAGEPLNAEVIAQVEQAWGLTIRDGFGQTETTALVGNTPGSKVLPGSMGRPLPGVRIELVDPATGRPGDEGEICIDLTERPMNLMTGYLSDEEKTAAVIAGGYYHTGDVATRDADGYITFVGRTDDVFKASDYKISPFELESVLIEHPAVAEAAVVPAPDPVRLAVPKAYVVLAAGWAADRHTALAILRHARERLAPYQRVRRLEFHDLPKTMSGKIRRVELRAREEEAARAGATTNEEWRDDQFPELRA
jgi:acetyl-CoA synthetase